jgi:polar amino acid transport system substrate-binding protein
VDKIKANGKLVVATSPDYPPYEFIVLNDKGEKEFVGLDIDLAKAIAEELGVELELQTFDFDGVLAAVATGTVDCGISCLTPDEERLETMDFSDVYYYAKQAVLIRKADEATYTALDSFNGKTVGAQLGTVQESDFAPQLTGSTIKSLAQIPQLVLELKAGNIDGLVVELPVAESYAKQHSDLIVAPITFENDESGASVAIQKGSGDDFIQFINEFIKKLAEEGKIDEFVINATELQDQAVME